MKKIFLAIVLLMGTNSSMASEEIFQAKGNICLSPWSNTDIDIRAAKIADANANNKCASFKASRVSDYTYVSEGGLFCLSAYANYICE